MRKLTSWMLPLLSIPMASAALAGPDAITVGVINDLSGVYADLGGQGSVVAAQIAVETRPDAGLGERI